MGNGATPGVWASAGPAAVSASAASNPAAPALLIARQASGGCTKCVPIH
jgi:hypothetical protein